MSAPEIIPFSDRSKVQVPITRHGGELRRSGDIATAETLAVDTLKTDTVTDDLADRWKALCGVKGSH